MTTTKLPAPLGVTVLIKKQVVEEKSEGGIILTEQTLSSEKMQSTEGTILAIGPKAWYDDEGSKLEVGDSILIRRYGGVSITRDGEEFHLVNDQDILAKL